MHLFRITPCLILFTILFVLPFYSKGQHRFSLGTGLQAFKTHTTFSLENDFIYGPVPINYLSFPNPFAICPELFIRYVNKSSPKWMYEADLSVVYYKAMYNYIPTGNRNDGFGRRSFGVQSNLSPLVSASYNFYESDKYKFSAGLGIRCEYLTGLQQVSIDSTKKLGDKEMWYVMTDTTTYPGNFYFSPNFILTFGKKYTAGNELGIKLMAQYGLKPIFETKIEHIGYSDHNNIGDYSYSIKAKSNGSYYSFGLYYVFKPLGSKKRLNQSSQ